MTPEDLEIEENEQEEAESVAAATETEESAESATAETPEKSESEQVEQPPKKGGVQRRIDELTRKSRLAEAEAEFWKQKAIGGQPEKQKADANPSVEPKPENFPTVAEYLKAVREYDREQLRTEMRSELEKVTQQQAERSEVSELQAVWSEREAEIAEANPDYKENSQAALDTLAEVKGPAKSAIAHAIQYSDAGPELLDYLGQNPEMIEELAAMNPTRAVIALGRLEGSLSKEDGEKATPHTRAPKPPTPVKSGKSSDSSELSDSLPPEVWQKRFMKRLAKSN